jgi:hypothetical protein
MGRNSGNRNGQQNQKPVEETDPVPDETSETTEPAVEPAEPAAEDVAEPDSDVEVATEMAHPTPERFLPSSLLEYIDAKLEGNGLAALALARKDARTLLVCAAEACVGIREEGGNNRGPLVEMMEDTIHEAHGMPWCMAFVQSMISYVEERTGVKSLLPVSAGCLDVWNKSPALRANADPLPGAIVVWRHGDTAQGHTGILRSFPGKPHETMSLVEGNTEAGVSTSGKVERDGGGVYATNRNKTGTGSMHVMGFLKPF